MVVWCSCWDGSLIFRKRGKAVETYQCLWDSIWKHYCEVILARHKFKGLCEDSDLDWGLKIQSTFFGGHLIEQNDTVLINIKYAIIMRTHTHKWTYAVLPKKKLSVHVTTCTLLYRLLNWHTGPGAKSAPCLFLFFVFFPQMEHRLPVLQGTENQYITWNVQSEVQS